MVFVGSDLECEIKLSFHEFCPPVRTAKETREEPSEESDFSVILQLVLNLNFAPSYNEPEINLAASYYLATGRSR